MSSLDCRQATVTGTNRHLAAGDRLVAGLRGYEDGGQITAGEFAVKTCTVQ
jgi:hypothetical protein